MGVVTDLPFEDRPPRGSGTNVHLKDGTAVFVQDNLREVNGTWEDARRHNHTMTFTGAEGKRVSLAPEDIHYLEEP